MAAQLKRALSGDAVKEAMALAKQREADLETMKGRTMAKFKEMASEKQQLEERIRALESGSGSGGGTPMSPLIAFDSPEAGSSSSDNLLTPPTGGANGGSPLSQQKLAEATSELMPSSVFRRRQKGATALYSLWYCRWGKCIFAAMSPSHLRGGNGGER